VNNKINLVYSNHEIRLYFRAYYTFLINRMLKIKCISSCSVVTIYNINTLAKCQWIKENKINTYFQLPQSLP